MDNNKRKEIIEKVTKKLHRITMKRLADKMMGSFIGGKITKVENDEDYEEDEA